MSLRDLFAGRASYDFVPMWRKTLPASAVAAVISLLLLVVVGLNLSIDFRGGGIFEVPVADDVDVAEARDALRTRAMARSLLHDTLTSADAARLEHEFNALIEHIQRLDAAAAVALCARARRTLERSCTGRTFDRFRRDLDKREARLRARLPHPPAEPGGDPVS